MSAYHKISTWASFHEVSFEKAASQLLERGEVTEEEIAAARRGRERRAAPQEE